MLLIVPNLTIYIHPYDKLIKEQISESSAKVRVMGSLAACGIWNTVKIALKQTVNTKIHHWEQETLTKQVKPKQDSTSSIL
jgi:hypothetical protein